MNDVEPDEPDAEIVVDEVETVELVENDLFGNEKSNRSTVVTRGLQHADSWEALKAIVRKLSGPI